MHACSEQFSFWLKMMQGNFFYLFTHYISYITRSWTGRQAPIHLWSRTFCLRFPWWMAKSRLTSSSYLLATEHFDLLDADVGIKPVSWRIFPPLPSTTTSKLATCNSNMLAAVSFSFCRDLASVLTLWLDPLSAKQVSPDAVFAGSPSLCAGLLIAIG